MKKWIAAMLIGAALLFSPFRRTDVSELLPIQTVSIRVSDGWCLLETDSGLWGQGRSLASALEDLKRTAPGVVELSTAKQLVICAGAEDYADELISMEVLRPGTELYHGTADVDATDVDTFLSRHHVEATVARARAAQLGNEELDLPTLIGGEGRYQIIDRERT